MLAEKSHRLPSPRTRQLRVAVTERVSCCPFPNRSGRLRSLLKYSRRFLTAFAPLRPQDPDMKSRFTHLLALSILAITASANGQELFGGSGIRDDAPLRGNGASMQWPSLFPKGTESEAPAKKTGWPGWNWFGQGKKQEESAPRSGPGMTNWFPRPNSTGPNSFQTFNENASEFWGKTSSGFMNWARDTNSRMRERTRNTWQSLSNGMTTPFGESSKAPAPPVRQSRNQSDQPRVRF